MLPRLFAIAAAFRAMLKVKRSMVSAARGSSLCRSERISGAVAVLVSIVAAHHRAQQAGPCRSERARPERQEDRRCDQMLGTVARLDEASNTAIKCPGLGLEGSWIGTRDARRRDEHGNAEL